MSYSIITYGFGPDGSINAIPVYGFYNSSTTGNDPLVDIEVTSKITRVINFSSTVSRSKSFNTYITRQYEFESVL